MMTKLRVTITFEYDANPKHYGTDVPKEMAQIDQNNWDEYPYPMIDNLLEKHLCTVNVEPVEC